MYRILFLLLLNSPFGFAQTSTDYSDVAVIVNDNASESGAIGLYFRQARNIPAVNIIHITAPVTEIIDSAEFEIIRTQVENYLINNNLVDSINYIVTTKGVPVRVERAYCSYLPPNAPMNCTTVESELALLFSSESVSIGSPGMIPNPYLNETAPFDHGTYGTYLVTRLDGFTYENVIALIDNSGPNTLVNPNSAQHIFDLINLQSAGDSAYFADLCEASIQWLQPNGWTTNYHPENNQLDAQSNVVDLVRYDYYSASNPQINYLFTNGSFAEIANTAWNFSFDPGTTQENNHLPSFIASGLTGGHTYAYSMYFSQLLKHENFVERYFGGTHNLAEASYASIRGLSTVDLVLGDPKSSVMPDYSTGIPDKNNFKFQFGPNPSDDVLTIIPGNQAIQSYALYDASGRPVHVQHTEIELADFISVAGYASGTYILEVVIDGARFQERIIIQH